MMQAHEQGVNAHKNGQSAFNCLIVDNNFIFFIIYAGADFQDADLIQKTDPNATHSTCRSIPTFQDVLVPVCDAPFF